MHAMFSYILQIFLTSCIFKKRFLQIAEHFLTFRMSVVIANILQIVIWNNQRKKQD